MFHLAEDRFDDLFSLGIASAAFRGFQFVSHPLFHACVGGKLVAAVVGVVALVVVLGVYDGGLVDAALAVSAPWFLVNAVCIPLYACRLLDVRAAYFFRTTLLPPLL